MTPHAISNKNRVALAINVIALLLVNAGGVGLFLAPRIAQAVTADHVSLGYACTDIDSNGVTDTVDMSFFADHYLPEGVYRDNSRYDAHADFDGDGWINDVDKEIFSMYFRNVTPTSENFYCAHADNKLYQRECPDIDGNGIVDTIDMIPFSTAYKLHVYNTKADFDQDGIVSDVDNAIFSDAFRHPDAISSYCANADIPQEPITPPIVEPATPTPSTPLSNENIINPLEVAVQAPLLTLSVTNDATTFLKPGDLVNYTAVVKNTGNAAAQNVTVTVTLPNGLFFTDTLGVEKTLTSGGALGPDDTMTLKYQSTIKNDTVNGIYKDAIKVTSNNNPDLNGGSSVEVRLAEVLAPKTTTLDVTLQSSAPFANPGDTVKYTVTVTNTGAAPAVDVHLKMTLPDGQTFTETGSAEREWVLGDIAVGGKVTNTIDGIVSETATAGIGKVSATATSVSISAAVTSFINIEVKAPQVLGAETGPTDTIETLAATGAGSADFLLLLSVGLLWIGLGGYWWKLRHQMVHAAGK